MPDLARLGEIVVDPDWYLDRVDAVARTASFVRSDRERLAATLFLDGRSPIATDSSARFDLSALDALRPEAIQAGAPRLIFHMSFCGSTQLALLVGESGAGIVLKEPQALVDLADWQRTLVATGGRDARFDRALDHSLALLSRAWPDAPPTVLKPSNWANNLVPLLGRGGRAVFVTIDRRSFLRAAFRGGRDRLAFTARAASHFADALGETALLAQGIAGVSDPLDRVARMVLLAHHFQQRLFAQAAGAGFEATVSIDYSLVRDDPAAALGSALDTLALAHEEAAMARAIGQGRRRDAKNPGRPFDLDQERDENRVVEHHHGERFDAALKWASDAHLGPAEPRVERRACAQARVTLPNSATADGARSTRPAESKRRPV